MDFNKEEEPNPAAGIVAEPKEFRRILFFTGDDQGRGAQQAMSSQVTATALRRMIHVSL